MLTPREQGDFGERAALYWLVAQGAHASIPFGHNSHYDLVADLDGRLFRVQVKTSARRDKDRWAVTVCTRGGNQSRSGLVKTLDVERFDFLFVVVADGRQWFIPAERVDGGRGILLGRRKYAGIRGRPGRPDPLWHGR
jgi:PD-(D/E)XK endonuclease